MKAAYDLIYLVSCSVNAQKPDKEKCAEMNLKSVFEAARRHSLTVAAANALEQAVRLPAFFTEEKFKALRRLSLLEHERTYILEMLMKHNLRYMPLKGIILKEFYPNPGMREMSDNDILIDDSKAFEVKDIMEQSGYVCRQFGKTNHDVYRKGTILDFEMHRHLFNERTRPKFYAYYQNVWKKLIKGSNNPFCYHFSHEDFYIFLICHLYKHYQSSGTGLRSLLDIYVYIKAFEQTLNQGYISGELDKLNLNAFEQGTKALAKKVFTGKVLNDDEKNELLFYIESNVHGTAGNLMAEKLNNDDSIKSKRRYVLRRIFPSEKNMQKYPLVARHKALYPLLVLYRPMKGMVKHRKQMKGEISVLKNFKKKKHRGKYNE